MRSISWGRSAALPIPTLEPTVGRRECVASGEGDTDGLEQALEDSVLAVGAMEHGEGYMELGEDLVALLEQAGRAGLIEIVVAIFGAHEDLGGSVGQRLHILIVGDI